MSCGIGLAGSSPASAARLTIRSSVALSKVTGSFVAGGVQAANLGWPIFAGISPAGGGGGLFLIPGQLIAAKRAAPFA